MSASKKNHSQGKASKIRIIAGQWRGRKLPVADEIGLRPTGDRLRETLFNWLIADIAGARCLDAFAGTGALGLEALSRGASFTQFVELNSNAAKQLNNNISLLHCSNAKVDCIDFTHWRQSSFDPFDIVFFDPPFADDLWLKAIQHLQESVPLSEDALIYIECPANKEISMPNHWQIHKHKKVGQISAALYKTMSSNPG